MNICAKKSAPSQSRFPLAESVNNINQKKRRYRTFSSPCTLPVKPVALKVSFFFVPLQDTKWYVYEIKMIPSDPIKETIIDEKSRSNTVDDFT